MKDHKTSIGREAAIALAETEWWKGKTDEEIVALQLYTTELCMDFGEFHRAVESVLGRPVWTHEFADYKHLQDEAEGKCKPPTLQEIMDMIPAEKLTIIIREDN